MVCWLRVIEVAEWLNINAGTACLFIYLMSFVCVYSALDFSSHAIADPIHGILRYPMSSVGNVGVFSMYPEMVVLTCAVHVTEVPFY